MWIFFTLVGLGLVFMLYALVQFRAETERHRPRPRPGTNAKPDTAGERQLLHMNSKQVARNDSGKTSTKGWSHGDGEISVRSIYVNGHVVVHRIRARRTVCSARKTRSS